MATRKRTSSPENGPSLPAKQAAQLLRAQRDKGQQLLDTQPNTSAGETAWETVTRDILMRAFGATSPNVNSVMDVGQFAMYAGGTEEQFEAQRATDMETRLEIIDGLIELLHSNASLETSGTLLTTNTESGHSVQMSNRVFLVHGHDDASIHETARFVEGLELPVTILREQPNSGRTIIEKFIDYSDVGFAIVLLTADDRGGVFADGYDEQRPRARQNVILELGFFLGKLGRNRVCALHQEGVEIPSDYSGVLFVQLDSAGAWRLALARELKAVGLDVDMNKAV